MAELTPNNYWPLGSTIQKVNQLSFDYDFYRHFGILAVNPINGTILIIYRKATDHVGSIGTICLKKSTNGGSTWSNEYIALQDPNQNIDLRNIGGGYSSDGVLFLFYVKYNVTNNIFQNNYFIKSTNDGNTWLNEQQLSVNSEEKYSPYGKLIDIGN